MQEILNNHVLLTIICWYIFMSFVQALPRPDDKSPLWYVILYQFAHALSANINLVLDPRKKTKPPDQT